MEDALLILAGGVVVMLFAVLAAWLPMWLESRKEKKDCSHEQLGQWSSLRDTDTAFYQYRECEKCGLMQIRQERKL